jgi:hypothetical protein
MFYINIFNFIIFIIYLFILFIYNTDFINLKLIKGTLNYTIDQGSPCPLATLNPFGQELLLSDVSTGFKRSTWIQRIL